MEYTLQQLGMLNFSLMLFSVLKKTAVGTVIVSSILTLVFSIPNKENPIRITKDNSAVIQSFENVTRRSFVKIQVINDNIPDKKKK